MTRSGDVAVGLFILFLFGAMIAGVYAISSWITVNQGQVVIVVSPATGRVGDPIVGPKSGMMLNGIFRILGQEYPVYINYKVTEDSILGMWGDGEDKYADYPAIATFSKDQLEMEMDLMLRWELDVDKIRGLYNNYPHKNWQTVIASIAREQIRMIMSTRYTAIETIENRDLVANDIKEAIIGTIEADASLNNAFINMEFELRNIGYPDTYKNATESKLAKEQQMIEAEFEANRIIIIAEANAKQVLIEAEAHGNASVLESIGMANAVELLAEQTNTPKEDIVKLFMWLDTLEELEQPKFIMFLGEDGVPLLLPID